MRSALRVVVILLLEAVGAAIGFTVGLGLQRRMEPELPIWWIYGATIGGFIGGIFGYVLVPAESPSRPPMEPVGPEALVFDEPAVAENEPS